MHGEGLVPDWVGEYQLCEQFGCTPTELRRDFSWLDIQRISLLNDARNTAQKVKADRNKTRK